MFPTFNTISVVFLTGLAMSAIVGPSMLYILSRSVNQGHKAGFVSSAGLAVGGILHAVLAALGISVLISYIPGAMTGIEIFGAIYLVYLGVGIIREKDQPADKTVASAQTEIPMNKIFFQGITVELFNPKTVLFFLAFLPPFVDQSSEYSAFHMMLLGVVITLSYLPSDFIISVTGASIAKKMASNTGLQNLLKYVSGGFLILLAVSIAFV